MAQHNLYPVFLCGGHGTRLWPISRTNYPKQFIKIFDGSSLFQKGIQRLHNKNYFSAPYIITNHQQRHLVAQQLKEENISDAKIFLEPYAKSTAPAITIAALDIYNRDSEAVMVALSSDSEILKPNTFTNIVKKAAKVAKDENRFLLFSSKPLYPETGYGYIQAGDIISNDGKVKVHSISHFKEKPSFFEAESCIKIGYQWNSGIFVLPVKLYIEEMNQHAPKILAACQAVLNSTKQDIREDLTWVKIDPATFNNCPEDSIDYALMEKTDKAAVVKTNVGWYDIGSWKTIYEIANKDTDGNVEVGNVIAMNNQNTYSFCLDKKRVLATIDVKDLTVVQTADATLVMPREKSQDVKKIVATLKDYKAHNFLKDATNHHSWGYAKLIDAEPRFRLYKLLIRKGLKVSYRGSKHIKQLVITKGAAEVKFGSIKVNLKNGDSIMIPKNKKYRIKNTSKQFLTLLKIETRSKLKSLKLSSEKHAA